MESGTVEKLQRGGGVWDLVFREAKTGFNVTAYQAYEMSDAQLQSLIDGVDPPPNCGYQGIRYDAETDRLVFACKSSIARALIASELATAVDLRQPPSQDVKPAKR